MDETVLPSKLLSDLSQAAEIIRSHDFIQVYSHYDADGISAAAIIAKTLYRMGKEFRVRLFTTLSENEMTTIESIPAECIIVTDLGASYIDRFDAMTCDVVVLDHHTIGSQAQRICYANPHLYGIDGMTEGCGATMAFLFAITIDDKNWDLVQVAMAGIAGDRQHIKGLLGLNAYLLKEGSRRGFIQTMEGSLIPLGYLNSELFMTTDPYIRGVSGRHEGVTKLLSDAGIGPEKYYNDLTSEEKRRLSSLIALKLTEQGVSLQTMKEVSRVRYYLPDWKLDAEMLAALLNGCGRLGLGGVGVAAGLGDAKALKEAADLETKSKTQAMGGVLALEEKGLTQLKNIQWFDSSSSGFTGIVCGIAMQFIGDPNKPTIGINRSESTAKVSSRGMWIQLDNGVDLSSALRESCKSVGGEGGGHKIASGGSFPSEKTEEFLNNLDRIVGEQISRAK